MTETQGPLIEHCKNTLTSFYGDDPQASESFGRIVNSHHFKYVVNFCTAFPLLLENYGKSLEFILKISRIWKVLEIKVEKSWTSLVVLIN